MATGGQKLSALQTIQSHIQDLEKGLTAIEERQKLLSKQKKSVEEDIVQELESLVAAVKKCHARASKHLDEAYEEKWRKLEDAKERLKERKKKAEHDLIVDHNPVEIPYIVEFSYTITIDKAMRSIEAIKPKSNNELTTSSWKVKLEKPEAASTCSEKRKIEATTSASTSEVRSDDVPLPLKKPKVENTSKMTLNTLRDFIKCTKCRKPRCVYSDRGLKKDEQNLWYLVKNSLRYQCGKSLFSPLEEMLNVEPVNCSKLVHWHCFSPKALESNFPEVCYHCGHEMAASTASSQESKDHDISPVCSACSEAGIGPRIRKKRHRPTKGSKSIVVNDDDD